MEMETDNDDAVEDALYALDKMPRRRHNDPKNEVHSCRCGALVIVPEGHAAIEDDDKEVRCHECDKPLGVKLYETFAR